MLINICLSKFQSQKFSLLTKISFRSVIGLIALYALLLIPSSENPVPDKAKRKPFIWNQDARWEALESQFVSAKTLDKAELTLRIDSTLREGNMLLDSIASKPFLYDATIFDRIENNIFQLGPLIGASPEFLQMYISFVTKMRSVIKDQSRQWNVNSIEVRNRLYRLLYGGRIATEEIMLQSMMTTLPSLTICDIEPSQTVSANALGLEIHSGDIFVSRGGAPTSALIARGSDYPGNFSHVALVYVEPATKKISMIESHIERGVVISSFDEYIKDKKLRIMVLRLRHDLPQMLNDAMLPHKAAEMSIRNAHSRHIPYDFEMNYRDTVKQFCSEVVSSVYKNFNINLWIGISSISTIGVSSWLAAFGVKNFETEEPSDLEYDPQLRVVAEWRDPETLYQDHLDNAVIDAMLEGAEAGEKLKYDWYMLPVARVAKTYSVLLNLFGEIGPIPEGMSATAALRNKKFSQTHLSIKTRLIQLADTFRMQNGYTPPYWELVKLAREAKKEI